MNAGMLSDGSGAATSLAGAEESSEGVGVGMGPVVMSGTSNGGTGAGIGDGGETGCHVTDEVPGEGGRLSNCWRC